MKVLTIAFATLCLVGYADGSDAAPSKSYTQDVALGRAIFDSHCSNCHDNSEHMLNDAGPALFGIVGRRVGSVEGYAYSPALIKAHDAGEVWTTKSLDRFLRQPYLMHPGTEMGMNFEKSRDRRAIIAYLKTLHGGE